MDVQSQVRLLLCALLIALLPDLDILPGMVLLGDPRVFHHQATHSGAVALVAGVLLVALANRR